MTSIRLPDEIIEADRKLSPSERLRAYVTVGLDVLDRVGNVDHDMVKFYDDCAKKKNFLLNLPTQEAMREHLHMLHFAGSWAQFGFNVFELTPDLAGSLLMTEPAKLDGEELHLPFRAFIIALPPGIVPFFTDKDQFWVEHISVERFSSVYVRTDETTEFFRVMCMAKGMQLWRDRFPKDLDSGDQSFTQIFANDPVPVPQDDLTLDHAIRIVKNLLMWLDFTGGLKNQERKKLPKKARKKVEKGDVGAGALRTWIIGNDVRLAKDLKDRVRDFALGNSRSAPEGWKVRVKHIVRGHWKMQAHGPGRMERKRLWVEPYYRGPEGPTLAHVYKAKE